MNKQNKVLMTIIILIFSSSFVFAADLESIGRFMNDTDVIYGKKEATIPTMGLTAATATIKTVDIYDVITPGEKAVGSHLLGLTSGFQVVYNFNIYDLNESFGYLKASHLNISLIDLGYAGETIRMEVRKSSKPNTVWIRSAKSPNSAQLGIWVKEGDKITVTVSYPYGFIMDDKSPYQLSWALMTSGWVLH